MEHIHLDLDIGYDEDNGDVKWASVTDVGRPIRNDERSMRIFREAVEHFEWVVAHYVE